MLPMLFAAADYLDTALSAQSVQKYPFRIFPRFPLGLILTQAQTDRLLTERLKLITCLCIHGAPQSTGTLLRVFLKTLSIQRLPIR